MKTKMYITFFAKYILHSSCKKKVGDLKVINKSYIF